MTVLHVISVVFGMGAALMSDILFSFFSKDKKLNSTEISTLSILRNIVFYGLIIICISGACLFFSDITKYSHSVKFLCKMSIMAVLLVNGYVLNKYIWPHLLNKNFLTLKRERDVRKLAFLCGAVSVISWLSVCGLGVLHKVSVSYTFLMSAYFIVIFFGVITSLLLEKKEFD